MLATSILVCAVSCCSKLDDVRIEMPIEQLRNEAMLENSFFCIVLIDDACDIQQYEKKIISNSIGKRCLWNFLNVNNQINIWYKWALGISKFPVTLVFNTNNILVNTVYGVSEYACKSIIGAISSSDNIDIPYKNFGFRNNSIAAIEEYNMNDYIHSIMNLFEDTLRTPSEKFLIADRLSLLYENPFTDYLKVFYGVDFLKNDDVDALAMEYVNRYAYDLFYMYPYFELVQNIGKSILYAEMPYPIEIEVCKKDMECNLGDTLSILVSVKNTSDEDVEIKDIIPGCDCIKMPENVCQVIFANETISYVFSVVANKIGKMNHKIYFFTDCKMPLTVADITINVSQ